MADRPNDDNESPAPSSFEQASKETRPSLAAEFVYFLSHSKKWWLLPILLVLGVVSLLAMFGASGVAPFIYALF